MALSAFDCKSKEPDPDEIAAVLGCAARRWKTLKEYMAGNYAPLTEKWKYSGKPWGWALQLKQKKRTVLYLTPCKGYFYAGFAFGERAVKATRDSGLPGSVMSIVDNAQKFAEGRAVRIEVRSAKDVGVVKRLIAIKMAN
jgi:hypothetical protein